MLKSVPLSCSLYQSKTIFSTASESTSLPMSLYMSIDMQALKKRINPSVAVGDPFGLVTNISDIGHSFRPRSLSPQPFDYVLHNTIDTGPAQNLAN